MRDTRRGVCKRQFDGIGGGAVALLAIVALTCLCLVPAARADTQKPVLHGQHWVAITGKPLAAMQASVMKHRILPESRSKRPSS